MKKPGFGIFHITTSSENQILEKLQSGENPLTPEDLYQKAGIELVEVPEDFFGKKRHGMAWWKSVNEKYLIK